MKAVSIVRWVARVWGTLILAFVLFFFLAGIFGEQSGEGLRDARELITFLMFPIGTIAGLGIAWRSEGVGGLIATASIGGLFALRPDLIATAWFALGIAPPGILFLVYWFMTRSNTTSKAGAAT